MSLKVSTTGIEIDGGTTLYIQDGSQKIGKILTTGPNGLVRWTDPKSIYGRGHYVGELYGGGIVVKVWEEGGHEKVLIAALSDQSFTTTFPNTTQYPMWTVQTSSPYPTIQTLSAPATSTYNGEKNFKALKDQYTWYLTQGPVPLGAAPSLNSFQGTLNGYSDWYVPSLYEMNAIAENAVVINKILGEGNIQMSPRNSNARYWTSTEVDASNAWNLEMSPTASFVPRAKSSTARLRPVRLDSTILGDGLIFCMDMGNKKTYNDIFRGNKLTDVVNFGATSSYTFTIGSGATYSTEKDGILRLSGANTTSKTEVNVPIGNTDVVTVEMWINISSVQSPNNTGLFTLFSWVNDSGIGFYNIAYYNNCLGFQSNNVDLFGRDLTDSAAIRDNWTHLVFIMRESSSLINNEMFVNGEQVPLAWQFNQGNMTPANITFHSGNAIIGGNYQSNFYNAKADIGVLRIYNRALTLSEVQKNFDGYKRKYEIGIPNTHSIQNILLNPATFSVIQNLSIRTTGLRNERVLRASTAGTASWADKNYMISRPNNEMEIGDTYGGGIIVSKWKYPANVNRYLIMSKEDLGNGTGWSNVFPDTITKFLGFANNYIQTSAVQSDGKILLGGSFTTYGGLTRARMVRLNTDGTVDTTFSPGFNNSVFTIAVQGNGKILVGGIFSTVTPTGGSSTTAISIVRLNTDGTIDSTFPIGSDYGIIGVGGGTTPSFVHDIKQQSDGKILVAGTIGFHRYNSTNTERRGILRLNSDGTLDTTFVVGTGFGIGGSPRKMSLQSDGKIVVGGYFSTYNGTNRNAIARLNTDGTLDTTFANPANSQAVIAGGQFGLETVEVQPDGKILVAGYLNQYISSGTTYTINGFARLNSNATIDTGFGYFPGPSNDATIYFARSISDGRILLGGDFNTYNGVAVNSMAIVSSSGVRQSITLTLNNSPSTISFQSDGAIVVGGDFTTFNSAQSQYLAAFYLPSNLSSELAANLNDDFRGRTNTTNIIAQPGHTFSSAKLCSDYRGGGFSDWYLPSIFELKQAFNELNSIGYALGESPNGRYWSSSHWSKSRSQYALSFSFDKYDLIYPGRQRPEKKSNANKVRAFREVAQTANYVNWTKTNPWDDPDAAWETTPGSESIWTQYSGVSSRNILFHFNANNRQSYDGFRGTASNLATPSQIGNLLTGVTFSSEYNAMVFNGTFSGGLTNATNSFIDFGTAIPATSPSLPYTMEAWVNPISLTHSVSTIFAVGARNAVPNVSKYSGIWLDLIKNPSGTETYRVAISIGDGLLYNTTSVSNVYTDSYPITSQTWHHIVGKITSVNPIAGEIYINGVKSTLTSTSGSITAISWTSPGSNATYIGQGNGQRRVFSGLISVCRLYNSNLTEKEIKDNFEADRMRHGV